MQIMIIGIVLVIFASLVIATTIAYSLNYWDDNKEEFFYAQNFDPDKKKIFLIGSSQVLRLNATFIEKYISTTQNDFEVYNLAKAADQPKFRINHLQEIIDAKPAIVVYGITFRDLQIDTKPTMVLGMTFEEWKKSLKKQTATIDAISQTKPNQPIADPEKFFQNLTLDKLLNNVCDGCGEIFNPLYLKNQQDVTLRILVKSLGLIDDKHFPDTPFRDYRPRMYIVSDETTLKQHYELLVKNNGNFNGYGNGENFNSNDLEEIVSSLKKNNVTVILFSIPFPNAYLEEISESDIEIYTSSLEKIAKESDAKVYHLYDKYAELNIWSDVRHVSMTNTTSTYSLDIAEIILQEIER